MVDESEALCVVVVVVAVECDWGCVGQAASVPRDIFDIVDIRNLASRNFPSK